MKFLALAPLLGAICNFLLSIFVLASDRKSPLNQIFFLWGISITVWNAGTFALFSTTSQADAAVWAHWLFYGVIFIPITLFHLSLRIAQIEIGKYIFALYAFQAGLAVLNTTGHFIHGVRYVGYAWYAIAGPGFWIYSCTLSLTVVSVIILTVRRRHLPALQQKRLNGLILAQALLVFFGMNDILPILGVDQYPGTDLPIYPYGSIAAVFYGIIVGYSVLQHQLLDVQVTLGRIAAHLVRFLFLFLIGLALQLTLTALVPGNIPTAYFVGSLAVLIVSTLIASLLFPRLLGSHAERLERSFLGDRFEYQDRVRTFIENMTWYNDVDDLMNDLHDLLTRTFKLASYKIILRDETDLGFTLVRAHPEQPTARLPQLRAQSAVFQYFEWGKAEYLGVSANYSRAAASVLERQAREPLLEFDSEFCFPLTSENTPFGLVLVGPKISQEPYTATDINLLVAIVKSMSLIVNQIRLKTQILHAQELDLLGKMSRGMAHDLNNLLTPVWTLLQLSLEDGGNALDEELLPVALRNVKTMRAYIKEALFFSENLRPDLQLGRLDLVVRQAIEVARAGRPKEVEITAITPEEVTIDMDEVLIQRLLANLISNAIDASPAGGTVQVVLERLPKVDSVREWLRVRVIDHGEGIPKENLSRILTPYFTTKNRGDENRGFGLGLAICRKIVTLHGGNLAIRSQIRKGTTVQVDLPSRHVIAAFPPVEAAAS